MERERGERDHRLTDARSRLQTQKTVFISIRLWFGTEVCVVLVGNGLHSVSATDCQYCKYSLLSVLYFVDTLDCYSSLYLDCFTGYSEMTAAGE